MENYFWCKDSFPFMKTDALKVQDYIALNVNAQATIILAQASAQCCQLNVEKYFQHFLLVIKRS